MKKKRKFYKLNYHITSPEVRLLGDDDKQIGVVTRIEALQKAKEQGTDLVEIAPNAKPPVCKLVDFKKFRYLESKKEREIKKKQKNVGVKEIRLRPFIGDHDFNTRVEQSKDFLASGNQVKINVLFRGRQHAKREFGYEIINKFIKNISDISKVVREPHMEGRVLSATVSYKKPNKEEDAKEENQKNSNQKI